MAGPVKPPVVTVKLQFPVTVGSETITELVFRRMKAKDLDGVEISGITKGGAINFTDIRKVAARVTGQTDHVMGEIDAADFPEVVAIILGFIGLSEKTGETPSP